MIRSLHLYHLVAHPEAVPDSLLGLRIVAQAGVYSASARVNIPVRKDFDIHVLDDMQVLKVEIGVLIRANILVQEGETFLYL